MRRQTFTRPRNRAKNGLAEYLVKQPALSSARFERLPETREVLLKIEGFTSLPISRASPSASHGDCLFTCPERLSAGSSIRPGRSFVGFSQDVPWAPRPAVVAVTAAAERRRRGIGCAYDHMRKESRSKPFAPVEDALFFQHITRDTQVHA